MLDFVEPKSPLDVLKKFKDTIWGDEDLWNDAHFILADVPVHADEAKRILPRGMRLTDPPTATLFIVDYHKTSFTEPYREAAVLLHVRTALGKGVHCPWMIVDDDTALIYGRELLGYPKKLGVFEFKETKTGIKANISRRGTTVLEIEGKRGAPQDPAPPVFSQKTFNAGGPSQLFLVNPVWVFHPTEVIHESYEAEVKVTLGDSEYDPIARFVSDEAVSGRIVIMDIPSGKYHLPVGMAGLMHFGRTFVMRFR